MQDNLVFNGVLLIPLIMGIVQFAKKLNLQGEWLTVLSAGVAVLLGVFIKLATMYPVFSEWFGVILFWLAVGMSVSGLYDLGKTWSGQKDKITSDDQEFLLE